MTHRILGHTGFLLFWILGAVPFMQAAETQKPLPGSEPCAGCHDPGRRSGRREPGMPPNFDAAALRASPHAEQECTACHADLAKSVLPAESPAQVLAKFVRA